MDLPDDKPTPTTALPKERPNFLKDSTLTSVLTAFGAGLLIVAAIALLFGQQLGYKRGISYAAEQAKRVADGEEISASNVKALKTKATTLQSQLTTAQQERDISLANLADLREDIQGLKVENLQAQQSEQFLIQSLAKKGGTPLQIIGAKIEPLPENAYEYRFDIGRVDAGNQSRVLVPKLTLLDDLNMVEVPLEPNSYKINGIARIRGRFIMPKNFSPKQVKLGLSVGNEKAEHIYDWQLGQPIDNMPYSLAETPEADKRPVSNPDAASAPASVAK